MDAQQYKVALYGQGLFDSNDNRKNVSQANELADSGFNTLMLFSLHVHEQGQLYWGDHSIAERGQITYRWKDEQQPSLPQLLARLREGGFTTIQFSIGSADAADWAHIEQLLASQSGRQELQRNFAAVAQWLSLDGFDFDCEEEVSDATIVTMTGILAQVGRRNIITYGVYGDQQRWLTRLQMVYATNGRQLVDWWNLQLYAGGGGNDPADWIKMLENSSEPIGVDDRAAFIVPGLATDENGGPSGICDRLHDYAALRLTGAFVWNSGGVLESSGSAREYGTAVVNGLSGQPCG